MRPIEYKLVKAAESVSGAVSQAGDTCFTIVAGQIAGVASDWIDKFFLTEEDGSHFKMQEGQMQKENTKKRQPRERSLDRKKAKEMAKKLSKNVSAPDELII